MKKIAFLLITTLVLSTLFSCNKVIDKEMTVVKDCTGVYLRFEKKDYHVCNADMVQSFADGAVVKVSFKTTKNCAESSEEDFVCLLLHENEGWVYVKTIE